MAYYFINADGERDPSFVHKMAFAGDNPQRHKIGQHSSLSKARSRRHSFLVFGWERLHRGWPVETAWDQKLHVGRDRLRYKDPVTHEYRISVDWYKDWREEPKPWTLAGLHVPRYYYQRIAAAVYPQFEKWAR